MSDPVTNVDIEDVLSSIRRLVADNDWSRGRPFMATHAESPVTQQPDKFVLTAALRVVETEVPDSTSEPVMPAQAQIAPQAAAQTFRDMLESGAALARQADAARDLADADDSPASVADRMSELERMIAELEAAVNIQRDDWEPDGTELDPLIEPIVQRIARPMADPAPETRLALDAVPEAPFVHVADDEDEEIGADVLSMATGGSPFDLAEAGYEFEEKATDPADQVETESESEEMTSEQAAYNPDPDDYFPSDDPEMDDLDDLPDVLDEATPLGAVIDEAMLRDLVREVLREELQGALGERITRNVRKLVRREIYSALAQKDFE